MIYLVKMLEDFGVKYPQKSDLVERALSLLETYNFSDRPFYRDSFDDGHFTAGVLVLNRDETKILLMKSKKFGTWQQFGGHADGERFLRNVALREFVEESGIPEHALSLSQSIGTLDIHEIPAMEHPIYGAEPAHYHYDINFLGYLSEGFSPKLEDEDVVEIDWFGVDEVFEDDEKFSSGLKNMLNILRNR